MADDALDADALRRDRQRYAGLLQQAEQQIAEWNERVDHLQHVVDGLDRLIALADDDRARERGAGRGSAPVAPAEPSEAGPVLRATPAAGGQPAQPADGIQVPAPEAASSPDAPAPTATPAAPEPVEPPAAPVPDAPRGTDAIRVVLESEPERTWTLPDLLGALGRRGWLPTSRRPEEGVRISLKRLAERGGVIRTEDGRWRLAGAAEAPPEEEAAAEPTWRQPPPAAVEEQRPAPTPVPPPPPRPASFGRPVGGTVTEL